MPPPSNNLKRKTLAERAGETARPAPAPPSSRPVNSYVRATSIAGAARDTSFSSSVSSSRPPSVASGRNVSNSSYSSSVGPGSRPPPVNSYRPQTAMGHSRIQRPTYTQSRPATSLEVHEEDPDATRVGGKRKGRGPFPSPLEEFPEYLKPPKLRGRNDTQMNCTASWESRPHNAKTPRETSLVIALNSLSLNGDIPQSAPKADAVLPPTPSQIPKLIPRAALPAETPSPSKSPKKTPKPLPLYLNRESNTLIAWDTDSRLEEVENMCSQFKEKMDGATTESNGLKEMITVYKIRSMKLQCIQTRSRLIPHICSRGTGDNPDSTNVK